jgi:imidazolonepropionase-like amidohydrolase
VIRNVHPGNLFGGGLRMICHPSVSYRATIWLAAFIVSSAAPFTVSAQVLALRGATIHTAAGPPIVDGIVVIRDGKIEAVGPSIRIPAGAEIFDVTGREIIPGMMDNHSHIGFPIGDVNERRVRFGPQHRILDVLSPDDEFWEHAVQGGVTTVVTGPGSGEVSSGEAAVVKTWGSSLDARILMERGGLKIAMGRKSPNMAPSTSMAVTALLRAKFIEAQEYMAARERWESGNQEGPPPARDLAMEALARVLRGEDRIRSHVHSAHDILSIMRLSGEFGFDLTLHHATEVYKVADEVARRGVKVVGMPLFARIGVDDEIMRTGAVLVEKGILFAFHTDDPVVQSKWQRGNAGLGIRYGMSETDALAAVTINPATIAGVQDRVGSIEVGKDADLVVIDGRWFEPRSRIDMVFVDGQLAYDRSQEGQ